jgi:hypothetical protein
VSDGLAHFSAEVLRRAFNATRVHPTIRPDFYLPASKLSGDSEEFNCKSGSSLVASFRRLRSLEDDEAAIF